MEDLAKEVALALLILAGAVILSLIVGRLLSGIIARFSRRIRSSLDDVIVRAAMFPLRALILVFAVELALGQLSFIPTGWEVTPSLPGQYKWQPDLEDELGHGSKYRYRPLQ